jgi:RNA polymerase sigma-70 factor (ECF subfamily)
VSSQSSACIGSSSRDWTERDRPLSLREARQDAVSDEELMSRLQADDSNVLEPLFRRYSKLLFSIAFRILRDRGEAEEVVQEVFFCLFQRARLYDSSKGTPKTWIVQVASHRALDRKAYLRRRGFYVSTDFADLENALFEEADLERNVGARHDLSQIERALDELSEGQRRTLGLYYFGALELKEIADRLNQPLGNVRHHFYRGLERLRRNIFVRRLRESEYGQPDIP